MTIADDEEFIDLVQSVIDSYRDDPDYNFNDSMKHHDMDTALIDRMNAYVAEKIDKVVDSAYANQEELVALVKELISNDAQYQDSFGYVWCLYCDTESSWEGDFKHTDECLITRARKLVGA